MGLAATVKGTKSSIIMEFPTYDDSKVYIALRLLSAMEDLSAAKAARLGAVQEGLEHPKEGDPEYDLRIQAEILALCAEDTKNEGTPEEPKWASTGQKFFTSSDEILQCLDQDRMHLLYQAYQIFRTSCGKQINEITPETLAAYVQVMGSERGDKEVLPFYSQFKPGLLFRLARITASPVRTALESSSTGGPATTSPPGETTPV